MNTCMEDTLKWQKSTKEHQIATWLSVSESEAEETNVIAKPLVPNLPARPTCGKFSTKICFVQES